jgi:predicted MFS family arabinose efflux permease
MVSGYQATGHMAFFYYSNYILQMTYETSGGITPQYATMLLGPFMLIGSLIAIITVERFNRKTLLVRGSAALAVVANVIAIALYFKENNLVICAFFI